MADTVAFVLEFLRGLMPSFNPLPLSCHRLFFWFFPVTSQLPPSSTSLLSPLYPSTIYYPPSTEGVGVLSVGESLSGKVWLFNFLAREPRPPLLEETSISAPDEHFFLLPCQPSYRVTLMTVELCFPRTDYRPADWSAREGDAIVHPKLFHFKEGIFIMPFSINPVISTKRKVCLFNWKTCNCLDTSIKNIQLR